VHAESDLTLALPISDEEQNAERVQVIMFILTYFFHLKLMCMFPIFCAVYQM